MKKLFSAVLLLGAACAIPQFARAQAAVYGEFTADKMQNLVQDNVLYGVTAGISLDGPVVLRHVTLGGDVEGQFLHKSNFNFDTASVGARATVGQLWGFRPYAGFNVGFGRIKNVGDQAQPSTDALIEIKGGLRKRLSPHFDAQGEYSYTQFYAFGGEYNPKAFNAGVVYYFAKR